MKQGDTGSDDDDDDEASDDEDDVSPIMIAVRPLTKGLLTWKHRLKIDLKKFLCTNPLLRFQAQKYFLVLHIFLPFIPKNVFDDEMQWGKIQLQGCLFGCKWDNNVKISLNRLKSGQLLVRGTSKVSPQDGSTCISDTRAANYWPGVCCFVLLSLQQHILKWQNTALIKCCCFTVFTLPHARVLVTTWVKYRRIWVFMSNSTTVLSYPFAAGDFGSWDFRYAGFWSENVMSNLILELSLEL